MKTYTNKVRGALISSVRVEVRGGHAHVAVWNRHGKAGDLVVNAEDGDLVAMRLMGPGPHTCEDDEKEEQFPCGSCTQLPADGWKPCTKHPSYHAGFSAQRSGRRRADNPHRVNTVQHLNWAMGWGDADAQELRELEELS